MTDASDQDLMIAPGVVLKASKLSFTFSRAGGPGGQNVNKLNTRATLTVYHKDLAQVLPVYALTRLASVAGSATTAEGLQFTAADSRSQLANRKACLDKLRVVLVEAMRRPKIRRKTKPSKRAVQQRLDAKKQRGQVKQLRKDPKREQ
ncbi:MAG: alternative ribosome rescue aminoacyl-tRNA hydrolase ArfB [Planctomycetota bacterium]